jgi:hypothetical protein
MLNSSPVRSTSGTDFYHQKCLDLGLVPRFAAQAHEPENEKSKGEELPLPVTSGLGNTGRVTSAAVYEEYDRNGKLLWAMDPLFVDEVAA